MIFPGAGPLPRHPSQLYEAGLEGLVLGLILCFRRARRRLSPAGLDPGCSSAFMGWRGFSREFFREPDPQLGLSVRRRDHGHAAFRAAGLARAALIIVHSLRRGQAAAEHATAEGR